MFPEEGWVIAGSRGVDIAACRLYAECLRIQLLVLGRQECLPHGESEESPGTAGQGGG